MVDGCAELVVALLERSPSIRVIATSRQPLGVPGEQVWRVGGLDVAEARRDAETDQSTRRRCGGAVHRARPRGVERVRSGGARVRDSVQRICRWLDGMPLAIELAAARVPVLVRPADGRPARTRQPRAAPTLADCARAPPHARVDARMEPPAARARGAAPVPPAQRVPGDFLAGRGGERMRRLPAGHRGRARPARDPDRPLARPGRRGARGAALPAPGTVRQYAAAKLWDGPEGPTVHSRHAEYFLSLAVAARDGLGGREQPHWVEQLEVEHDNLEAALQWLSRSRSTTEHGWPAAVAVLVPAWLLPRGPHPVRAAPRAGPGHHARAPRPGVRSARARSRSCSATTRPPRST